MLRSGSALRVAALGLLAGLPACLPAALFARHDPFAANRTQVRTMPSGWRNLAILPFGGDPAFRRPAEEQVALELRAATPLGLMRPYAAHRWFLAQGGPTEAEAVVVLAGRWSDAAAEGREVPADEVLALAGRLGVDALLLGASGAGGWWTQLALFDGATGAPVAAVRRGGSNWAADDGPVGRSEDATRRALVDMARALRTPAGEVPALLGPAAPTEGEPAWPTN